MLRPTVVDRGQPDALADRDLFDGPVKPSGAPLDDGQGDFHNVAVGCVRATDQIGMYIFVMIVSSITCLPL